MTTAIASAMKHLAAAASAALLAALLMAPAAALAAPATTSQGIGPYEIEMPSATFNAQLLRRDGDTIWLRRVGPDGTLGPQIGYEHTDIVRVNMPPPGFFSNLYALVDAPTPPPASARRRRGERRGAEGGRGEGSGGTGSGKDPPGRRHGRARRRVESSGRTARTPPVYLLTVSRPLELSLQSSFQLSLTVLVDYRSRAGI